MRNSIIVMILAFAFMKADAQQKLSLQQSKDIAFDKNISIKNGGLQTGYASEGKEAASAAYYPKVDFNGLILGGPKDFVPAASGILPKGINNFYLGSVMAQQTLYAGGKINTGNALAKLQIEVSQTRLKQIKDSVNLITEQKYLQLIDLGEQYKTVLSNQKYLDTLYKEMQDFLKSGLIAKNELLKVKVKINGLILDRSKIANMKQVALLDFCQFIGLTYDPEIILTDSISQVADPASLYIKPEAVLTGTDDYKLLQHGVSAEELQTRLKRADYMPTAAVGLSGAVTGVINKGIGNTFSPVAVGVVAIPISGWWGTGKHILRQRKIAENIASNNLANGENLLRVRMMRSWYDLTEAYEQYSILEENLLSASENLKVSRDNYKSGLNNLTDLLNAQADLQQTESQLVDAKNNYSIKLSSYKYVTGKMDQ
ncbi:TolC family protein [Mucilaginibacter sp.]|uniref:TolC family protein n=1 Tax=Mucilaginibacter sp. TaxID=1882438 RepID=UPI00262BC85A|nr:TolC family protein [Mucilaginibacter sp.]MDB4923082.1 outer membrane protein TolC [Mucilaginibacter sp.]